MKDDAEPHQANILIATDFTETSEAAVQSGFATANRMRCVPHLVWVQPRPPLADPTLAVAPPAENSNESLREVHRYTEQQLEHYVRLNGPTSFQAVVSHMRTGEPAREVGALAASLESVLIVVGTAGRTGMKRLFLGSVAEEVVRLSGRPVLVIPSEQSSQRANDDDVPAIEPPCPVCLEERRRTGGAAMWCPQHRGPGIQRHVHHHVPRNVAAQENVPLTFPMGPRM